MSELPRTTPDEPGSLGRWEKPLLFFLPFILYAESYSHGLLFLDDHYYYYLNPHLQPLDWSSLLRVWTTPVFYDYMPLTHWTYWLDLKLFGTASFWGARIHNLAWFGLSVLAVRAFSARLSGRREIGFAVALLFALHPITTPTVVWLAERKNNLVCAFMLFCLERYIAARTTSDPQRSRKMLFSAGLFGLLALFSKSHAVALPPIILAWEITLGTGPWKKRISCLAPYVLAAGLYVLLNVPQRQDLNAPFLGGSRLGAFTSDGLIVWQYFLRVICPLHLSMYYPLVEYSPGLWQGWSLWLGWLAMLVLTATWSQQKRLIMGCWLMGLAALSPALNMVPQSPHEFDHWNHHALAAWLTGWVLLADEGLDRLTAHWISSWPVLRWKTTGLASVAVFFALLSFSRAPVFESRARLFRDSAIQQPEAALNWGLYLSALLQLNDPQNAEAVTRASLQALECPDSAKLVDNIRMHAAVEAAVYIHFSKSAEAGRDLLEREIKNLREKDSVIPVLMRGEYANRIGVSAQAVELLKPFFDSYAQEAAAELRRQTRGGLKVPTELPPTATKLNFNDEALISSVQRDLWMQALTQLAYAQVKCGELEEAFDTAAVLANTFPRYPLHRALLIDIYKKLGLPDAAKKVEGSLPP